ncbi:MAG TPA: type IV pilus assembly protein PilM [Patescibacteria group bacterium]|nr:type IV pilus assembly protein PilM [Patescibacteria group bacterium]
MFGLFEKDKINGFGLDIEETLVKVVQLSSASGKISVAGLAKSDLPEQIIANHAIINPDKLSAYIRKTMQEAKITTPYVVVSIPEAKSFVRQIHLPQMEEKQIETAVPFEFEQNIPVPIDQIYFDWQILTQSDAGYELLVTATPRDYVDSLIDVLSRTKLKPIAFELESQSSARALLSEKNAGEADLVIDISELQTSFLLVEKNNLQYTSSVPIGGRSFTESISRNLGIPLPEAEAAKREQGLVADSKKRNIRQAILPILDNIVDEIRNVIRFYDEHYKSHLPLKQVLIVGGGAKLMGLSDYVSARLNLGSVHEQSLVTLGDSLNHLTPGPTLAKVDGLTYCTAIGLGLRALGFKIDLEM